MVTFYYDTFAEDYVTSDKLNNYAPPERYVLVKDPAKTSKYCEDRIPLFYRWIDFLNSDPEGTCEKLHVARFIGDHLMNDGATKEEISTVVNILQKYGIYPE